MNTMALEDYKGVYVYAQQVDNKLSGIAFELLGKAKELAAPLNTEVAAVSDRIQTLKVLQTNWLHTAQTKLSLLMTLN